MVSYSPGETIDNLTKLDGATLGSKSKLLEYVRGNEAVFAGQIKMGDTVIHSHRIASILLLGIESKNINGKLAFAPRLIDISISKFNELAVSSSIDGYGALTRPGYFSETNHVSDNFKNGKVLASMKVSAVDASSLNKTLVPGSSPSYFGGEFNTNFGSADYSLSPMDRLYAGHSSGSTKYTGGINSGAALFYNLEVSDQLMTQFGYRIPDPTRPYSPFNWLCVQNGSGSNYFKILFLTELDLYLHSGIIDNPSLLVPSFVKGKLFNDMIASFKTYSNLGVSVDSYTVSDNASPLFHQRTYQTLLQVGDELIPGQYIYSKDFRFKLHFTYTGNLTVYRLPIQDDLTSSVLYSYISSNSWTRGENKFIGTVFKLTAGDFCIYENPEVVIEYTNAQARVTITVATPLSRRNDVLSIHSTPDINRDYKLFMIPGGEMVVASKGYTHTQELPVLPTDGRTSIINLNSKTSFDRWDMDCLDSTLFKLRTGTTISDPGSNVCYKNDILVPNSTTSGGPVFEDNSIRQILLRVGNSHLPNGIKSYDFFNYLFAGDFMSSAIKAGYAKPLALSDYINYSYCTRGDRYATDPICTSVVRNVSASTTLNEFNKKFIDTRIKSICQPGYDAKYNDLCSAIQSKNPTYANLIRLNPQLRQLVTNDKAYMPEMITRTVEQVFSDYGSFTRDELDIIFSHLSTPASLLKWQSIYATACRVTPFKTFDIKSAKNGSAYKYISQWIPTNNVFVLIKTTSGVFITGGDMDFPYTTSASSYSSNSLFLRQIMVSGTIYQGSKWSGPSYLPATKEDFQTFMKTTQEDIDVIDSLYESASIDIKDVSANILVYFKTLDPMKLRIFAASREAPTQTSLTTESICSYIPDVCASTAIYHIDNNPYDDISNKWCDLATSSKTIVDGIGHLSGTNKDDMLRSCGTAFRVSKCSNRAVRYKSGMTVSPNYDRIMFESFSHLPDKKENYEASCVDACKDAVLGTPMYDSCKKGTIDYCLHKNNIISPECIEGGAKFVELEDRVSQWCNENPTHSKYQDVCKSYEVQPSIKPTVEPVADTQSPDQLIDESVSKLDNTLSNALDTTVYFTPFTIVDIIVILMLLILLGCLVGGRAFSLFFKDNKVVNATSSS